MQKEAEVAGTLVKLARAPIAQLRQMWLEQFRADAPKAFGPDLLRRSLAQRIQEDAYGGLSSDTRKLLNRLIAQNKKNTGKIVLPRRIKAGAILVREWKGKMHRVTALKESFDFEGKPYFSLSKIARLITGARWNGPRFFGLRNNDGVQP